jgi:hypothetical protein
MTRTIRSAKKRARKAVLAKLAQRITDLLLAYVAVGRLTRRLRHEAFRLKDDVDTWRAQTGNDDIRATQLGPVSRAAHTAWKAMLPNGTGGWCHCPPIMISRGRLCFLVACDEKIRMCSWICFDLPRNGTIRSKRRNLRRHRVG